MRLYLDHDVDVSLAARLQQRGHDALTTREARHTEPADEQQLIVATAEERVFLTHNRRDFRRLHCHWIEAGRSHAGIIFLPTCRSTSENLDCYGSLPPIRPLRCKGA
jgi:predicted nuclease of predicted toxin-antitoxin system